MSRDGINATDGSGTHVGDSPYEEITRTEVPDSVVAGSNGKQALDVNRAMALINILGITGTLTVGNVTAVRAAAVGDANLLGRKHVAVTPMGSNIGWSFDAAITPSTAHRINSNTTLFFELASTVDLFLIKLTGGTATVIVSEAK